LTGERESYFVNYSENISELAETIQRGWYYYGQKLLTEDRKRGTDPLVVQSLSKFIFCIQNHDQIGNRAMGDRLNHKIPLNEFKAASALLLTVPSTPLLFMGQEWASSSPFQFFTDHHKDLGKLVTEGRRREFQAFSAFSDHARLEEIPDPQALETFMNSKLKWEERTQSNSAHSQVFQFYRKLIALRKLEPALRTADRTNCIISILDNNTLQLVRKPPITGAFSTESVIISIVHMKHQVGDGTVMSFLVFTDPNEQWLREKKFEIVLTSEDENMSMKPKLIKENDGYHKIEFICASAIILKEIKS